MRIIGFLVTGAEADRYLKSTLDEFKRLCDQTLVTFCNADKATKDLVKSYGFVTREDNREWGKHQPDIKTEALKEAGELNPDWIVALDADEVFDPEMTRADLEKMAETGIGYYFYIVNLWNNRKRYLKGWSFWNIRFYKYAPEYGLNFQKKNVHCGLAPPIVYHYGNYAPFFVKHYGLMKEADRKQKVKRYEKYDPNAVYKDASYYEMLKSNTTGSEFIAQDLRNKINEEVSTYKMKNIPAVEAPEGFVLLRKDGRVIDVPAKDARRYERQGWEFMEEISLVNKKPVEAPVEEADENECPVCGFVAKSEFGLKSHARKHE